MATSNAFKLSSSQSPFGVNYTSTDAVLTIATLKNTYNPNETVIDSSIDLDVHELAYMDFVSCFYSGPGGGFCILNKNFKPLLLTGQTYAATDSKKFNWNVYNQCLKTYSSKNAISENMVSPQKRMALLKDCATHQSLANNMGFQHSLDWGQVITGLGTTGQIKHTGDTDHHANVIFLIHYQFYSPELDVSIAANFQFKTAIPGYRNVYSNEEHCIPNPYSKAESLEIVGKPPSNTIISKTKPNENKIKEKINAVTFDDDNRSVGTELESLLTRQILTSLHDEPESDEDDATANPQW